jgi:hypothetical protein
MPGYNRTGPMGRGPITGGGFGFCGTGVRAGTEAPTAYGRGFRAGGRGLQRGFRRGRCFFSRGRQPGGDETGYGAGFGPRRAAGGGAPEAGAAELRAEAAELRRRLEVIEQRLGGREPSGGGAAEA